MKIITDQYKELNLRQILQNELQKRGKLYLKDKRLMDSITVQVYWFYATVLIGSWYNR